MVCVRKHVELGELATWNPAAGCGTLFFQTTRTPRYDRQVSVDDFENYLQRWAVTNSWVATLVERC